MKKRLIAAVAILFFATSFSGSGRSAGIGDMHKAVIIPVPVAVASIETEKSYRLFEVSETSEKAAARGPVQGTEDDAVRLNEGQVIDGENSLSEPSKKETEIGVVDERSMVALSSRSMNVSRGGVTEKHLFIENAEGDIVISDVAMTAGAEAIDRYFEERGAPLAGYGMVFARVSYELKMDWRLLPAIALRESTGGKELFRSYNPFGWGRVSFKSFDEAIETVGRHLAGLDPDTAGFYKDKTISQKLRKYNSVVQRYPEEVWEIMRDIGAH